MIRPLLITALCAFLASVGFFGIAAATVGSDFRKIFDDDFDHGSSSVEFGGPEIVRTLTWDGENELNVRVPATVHYTQGPTVSLTVKGPKGTVERIIVDDGDIRFDHRLRGAHRVEITMTAPDVSEFHMMGSQKLFIDGYNQPRLDASIAGSGDIVATGTADTAELSIRGSGDINAGGLASRRSEVHIAGSGDATVAPTDEVEVHIAGSGEVTLKTNPSKVDTNIAGSGRIIHDSAPAAPPAPAAAPVAAAPKAKVKLHLGPARIRVSADS